MQTGATHSPDLRIRDKASPETEVARLEGKVSIAKRTIHDLNAKIYELEKQGLKLANSLGFDTMHAAQAFIDLADDRTPYKELAERVERLQADHENTSAELQELRIERDALRANINASGRSRLLFTRHVTHDLPSESTGSIQKKLDDIQRRYSDLERRYDEMKIVKERSEARYKADYLKMESLKAYLRSEEIQEMEAQLKQDFATLSTTERRRRRAEITALKETKIAELEAGEEDGTGRGPLSSVVVHEATEGHAPPNLLQRNKENQQTYTGRRHLSTQTSITTGSQIGNQKQQSPTLIASPRLPLHFHNGGLAKQHLSSPISVTSMNDAIVLVPNSSQTEEEFSQGVQPFISCEIPDAAIQACPPALIFNSSDTKDDVQVIPMSDLAPPPAQEDRKPLIMEASTSTPKRKPRLAERSTGFPGPSPLQLADQRSKSKPRHSETSLTSATRTDDTDERPPKMRRVSSPGPIASRISMGEPGASAAMPLYVGSGDTPRRKRDRDVSASTGRRMKDKGKGIEKQFAAKTETSTPVANARASSSKQLADYSAYKGRGRYANDGSGTNTTINASFVIDPARNGGRDFQYDEVVRGREDRRNMNAGDCECCRDYYAAIGPIPKRLQAPLWRTPPSSPGGRKPCLHDGAGSARTESAEITSHKQAISRHRHHWARGSTPPSYWSIGFPTTQEAKDINEKARLMHQEKKRNVQEEADRDGGRYKRR
ncbi:hypothetical protein FB451DRAFT_1212053 [Mycena latifolia]|nr:hypothetical protein FB451DRAFT_1212053 [Mycena latifolia]